MKIRAAILESFGTLVFRDIYSEPLKKGQVLVKIKYSGVCRSQLMEVQGLRGKDKWLPHLLGHEASGVVIEVGKSVSKVKKGDSVILTWIKGKGIESISPRYKFQNKIINSGNISTFSNYSVVSENRLIKKPKKLAFDLAVLFGCAIPTGSGIVFKEKNINKESSVVILGLGGVGLSAVLMLLAKEVRNIIAIDISKKKLNLVKSWGVKNTIQIPKIFESSKVIKMLPSGNIDFCIESAGSVKTIELGFLLIRTDGGKLIFASHPPNNDLIKLKPHELISGKKIIGTWGGGTNPDKDIPIIFKEIFNKNIPIRELVNKIYKLEDLNKALSDLEKGSVFRAIIKMKHK